VAVHAALGWLLWGRLAPRTTAPREARSDVVEVSFEVEEVGGSPAAPAAIREALPVRTAEPVGDSSRTTGGAHVAATGPRPGEGATSAPDDEGQLAGLPARSGLAGTGGDRLSTFRPAHPDLLGPIKLSPESEKPRDLLASPLAKAAAGPRELPRVLRGPGGVTAKVGEDGSIHFAGPKDVALDAPGFAKVGEGVGAGLAGHFDVTDQIMKLAGQDPYASAKRALADETREARVCMARRFQGERQRQELGILAGKIRRLAARPDLSAAARRALIFDIWDECLEEAESGPDYGAMARATILAVVREVFPAGTDRGYEPAELLALNRRRTSRHHFAPYDPIAAQVRRGRHPDAGPPGECPVQ
jgi:hypothetical protein